MRKLKLGAVLVAGMLILAFVGAGISHAEDAYTYQYFLTNSAANFMLTTQGISGWQVANFGDNGTVSLNFSNATVNGLYNASYGVGSFRNQGSLAFVNIQPNVELPPATFVGVSFSQGNRAVISDYNYAVNLNFNAFRGSGIVVINLMAGSFSNQLTAVSLSMGKNVVPPPSPASVTILPGNPSLVTLSNQQMAAVAAAVDNDIQVTGRQSAVATIQGTPDVQGLCAITMSAGINNQVIHRVGVNINTNN